MSRFEDNENVKKIFWDIIDLKSYEMMGKSKYDLVVREALDQIRRGNRGNARQAVRRVVNMFPDEPAGYYLMMMTRADKETVGDEVDYAYKVLECAKGEERYIYLKAVYDELSDRAKYVGYASLRGSIRTYVEEKMSYKYVKESISTQQTVYWEALSDVVNHKEYIGYFERLMELLGKISAEGYDFTKDFNKLTKKVERDKKNYYDYIEECKQKYKELSEN